MGWALKNGFDRPPFSLTTRKPEPSMWFPVTYMKDLAASVVCAFTSSAHSVFLLFYLDLFFAAPFDLKRTLSCCFECIFVSKAKVKVKSLSHVWLFVTMNCSLPGSSVQGIFQARVLEWVAISFSRGSSRPRDWTLVSCTVGGRFIIWATRETLFFEPLFFRGGGQVHWSGLPFPSLGDLPDPGIEPGSPAF